VETAEVVLIGHAELVPGVGGEEIALKQRSGRAKKAP
jgi:hypothetical protein